MDHLHSVFVSEETGATPRIMYRTVLDNCKQKHGVEFADFIRFPELHGWQVTEDYILREITDHRTTDAVVCQKLGGYTFLQGWMYFQLARSFFKVSDDQSFSTILVGRNQLNHSNRVELSTSTLQETLQRWDSQMRSLFVQDHIAAIQRLAQANQMLELAKQVIIANVADQAKPISEAIGLHPIQSIHVIGGKNRFGTFRGKPKIHEREEALAIMILGETLSAALTRLTSDLRVDLSGWQTDENSGWGPPTRICEQMSGWCPRSLRFLKSKLGRSATLLFATLRTHRNNEHIQHNASKCDDHTCNFIEAASKSGDPGEKTRYEPLHNDEHCKGKDQCKLVGPNEDEILTVLRSRSPKERKDAFPLLRVREDVAGIHIDVKPWEANDEFATISHVWSQGLGNKTSNQIQICQLRAIQDYLREAFTPKASFEDNIRPVQDEEANHLFWLDTLAIPQNVEESTAACNSAENGSSRAELKKRAIDRIHHVFNQAKHCIIIDQHLVNTGRVINDYRTTAIGLLASAWMMRLWTLQEAFVSTSCRVVLEAGQELRPTDDLWKEAARENVMNTSLGDIILKKLEDSWMKRMKPGEEHQGQDSQRDAWQLITSAWRATRYRTIQHLEDETQVLASLLDIPIPQKPYDLRNKVDRRNQGSAERRKRREELMRDFWELAIGHDKFKHSIPAGIIFCPGKRLRIPGYGWAPQTWMCHEDESYPYPLRQPRFAKGVDTSGLLVQYPGFLLHASRERLKRILSAQSGILFEFSVGRELSEWYSVKEIRNSFQRHPTPSSMGEDGTRFISDRLLQKLSENGSLKMAIILSRARPGERPGEVGLLVEIDSKATERKDPQNHLNRVSSQDAKVDSEDSRTGETFYSRIVCRLEVSRLPVSMIAKSEGRQHTMANDGFMDRFAKFGADGIIGVAVKSIQEWCVDGYSRPDDEGRVTAVETGIGQSQHNTSPNGTPNGQEERTIHPSGSLIETLPHNGTTHLADEIANQKAVLAGWLGIE